MIVTLREWQYTSAEEAAVAVQQFREELSRRLGAEALNALKAYLRVTGGEGDWNHSDIELAAKWALAYQKARSIAACRLDAGDSAHFDASPAT